MLWNSACPGALSFALAYLRCQWGGWVGAWVRDVCVCVCGGVGVRGTGGAADNGWGALKRPRTDGGRVTRRPSDSRARKLCSGKCSANPVAPLGSAAGSRADRDAAAEVRPGPGSGAHQYEKKCMEKTAGAEGKRSTRRTSCRR